MQNMVITDTCLQPLLQIVNFSVFPHQSIIITFQENEIHCSVGTAVRLGKLEFQPLGGDCRL